MLRRSLLSLAVVAPLAMWMPATQAAGPGGCCGSGCACSKCDCQCQSDENCTCTEDCACDCCAQCQS